MKRVLAKKKALNKNLELEIKKLQENLKLSKQQRRKNS